MPPELLGLTGQDPKLADPFSADIWCLAETSFQALSNRGTFDTYGTLMQYVAGHVGFPSEALDELKVSHQGIRFIQQLMAPSPLDRPSSEQVINHPWVMIEDDDKSENDKVHCVEEACAVIDHDPQDEITQPDIKWTRDVDTATVRGLSQIQLGPDGHGSQSTSQREHSSHQEVVPKTAPTMKPERSFVLFHKYHDLGDENRTTVFKPSTSVVCVSGDSTSNWTQASLRLEGKRVENRLKKRRASEYGYPSVPTYVHSPVENSEGPQFARVGGDCTFDRSKPVWRIVSAAELSRRVLSELAYGYDVVGSGKVRPSDYCDSADVLTMLIHTGCEYHISYGIE